MANFMDRIGDIFNEKTKYIRPIGFENEVSNINLNAKVKGEERELTNDNDTKRSEKIKFDKNANNDRSKKSSISRKSKERKSKTYSKSSYYSSYTKDDSETDFPCSDAILKPGEWKNLTKKNKNVKFVYMDEQRKEKLKSFCDRPSFYENYRDSWDTYQLNGTSYYEAVQRTFCEFFNDHQVCLCTALCPKPLVPFKDHTKFRLPDNVFREELYRRIKNGSSDSYSGSSETSTKYRDKHSYN